MTKPAQQRRVARPLCAIVAGAANGAGAHFARSLAARAALTCSSPIATRLRWPGFPIQRVRMDTYPPGAVRLSRADAKAETRKRLLDSAEQVFVKMGYQGATLDSIAADAGFTKGAVYWHFRNKEALFLELLADGMLTSAKAVRILAGMPATS